MMLPEPILWTEEGLSLLDQRKLPFAVERILCGDVESIAEAIEKMVVRGAPAIGVAAAYGMALAAREGVSCYAASKRLAATRPTAVNLFWALRQMEKVFTEGEGDPFLRLLAEARRIHDEDIACNRSLGRHGQSLLPGDATVITHCNAGALATGGYGTALGVFRAAREAGKRVTVFADETRPRLQGARLTAWELVEDGFDVTVITDGMSGALMQTRPVHAVIVGADRIAANGDTANKIGTYNLAVVAARHHVPFYVAAPLSTVDMSLPDGKAIPIEERDGDEVRAVAGADVLPPSIAVWNPAFDVTPAELVTAIVTERGVLRPPYGPALASLFGGGGVAGKGASS
jgi:methylthioribose-1-phosphate isomerase